MLLRGPFYALLAFVLAWYALLWVWDPPPFILPGPSRVISAWWDNRGLIGIHATATLIEIGVGLALGVALGTIAALALALSPFARLVLRPMLVFSQALPVFALAPILTLWLGYGLGSKVAMATLIIFFPVTSSFFDGLMRTPPGYLDLARVMGGGPWRMLWVIRVPAALPALFSGLRLAAVYAPIGAVIGEWVGSAQGLGYLMLLANGRAKTDLMFASMFTLGICSVVLYGVVYWATAKLSDRLLPER